MPLFSGPVKCRPSGGGRFIIFAPNIHRGGGLKLLKSVCNKLDRGSDIVITSDRSISDCFNQGFWIKRTLLSWVWANYFLSKVSRPADTIIFFSSLPPVFRVHSKSVIFFQNELIISGQDWRSILRRNLYRAFAGAAYPTISQSDTITQMLKESFGATADTLPFSPSVLKTSEISRRKCSLSFFYPASGAPHKNHKNLISAWLRARRVLGSEATLTLTIEKDHPSLQSVDLASESIRAVGWLREDQLEAEYLRAETLIFPSTAETLGLPLFEASLRGLTIIASDLPFSSNIITPHLCFDPHSVDSIFEAILAAQNPSQQAHFIKEQNSKAVLNLPTAQDFLSLCAEKAKKIKARSIPNPWR